jgi:hypothetical protein
LQRIFREASTTPICTSVKDEHGEIKKIGLNFGNAEFCVVVNKYDLMRRNPAKTTKHGLKRLSAQVKAQSKAALQRETATSEPRRILPGKLNRNDYALLREQVTKGTYRRAASKTMTTCCIQLRGAGRQGGTAVGLHRLMQHSGFKEIKV